LVWFGQRFNVIDLDRAAPLLELDAVLAVRLNVVESTIPLWSTQPWAPGLGVALDRVEAQHILGWSQRFRSANA
jgi:hypothetical protein